MQGQSGTLCGVLSQGVFLSRQHESAQPGAAVIPGPPLWALSGPQPTGGTRGSREPWSGERGPHPGQGPQPQPPHGRAQAATLSTPPTHRPHRGLAPEPRAAPLHTPHFSCRFQPPAAHAVLVVRTVLRAREGEAPGRGGPWHQAGRRAGVWGTSTRLGLVGPAGFLEVVVLMLSTAGRGGEGRISGCDGVAVGEQPRFRAGSRRHPPPPPRARHLHSSGGVGVGPPSCGEAHVGSCRADPPS